MLWNNASENCDYVLPSVVTEEADRPKERIKVGRAIRGFVDEDGLSKRAAGRCRESKMGTLY